jgi:Flp pilus assembly protein TadG
VEHAQSNTAERLVMHLRRLIRQEEGQGMVEFAMVLPILMAVMLGIVQFGIIFNNYETLTDASRVAARRAATSRFIGDKGASARQAAKDAASNLNLTDAEIEISSCAPGTYPCTTQDWTTTGNEVTVKLTYPYDIKILDWTVKTGNLTVIQKESLE